MRENPPWVDRALNQEWDRVTAAGLPMPIAKPGKRRTFKEYGCGHYGCVMPTSDDRVVFKLTSDPTEAEFIKLAEPFGWPDGIVRYYGIEELDFQYKRRPVFAVWREAAYDVGTILQRPKDDYERRSRYEFVANLSRFKEHAARIRDALLKSKDRAKLWDDARKLEDWAWDNITLEDAQGVAGWAHEFTFSAINSYKGAYRLAASWRACAIIAEMMENAYLSDLVGGAFSFYMERGFLLADVHAGNVGRVDREDYGPGIWVITDPGHVVVLS